ncbi:four helix bundle protein [Moorena producens]|uniref:four helix bundle protein n=1 Tax=Moorena producens TaxID=1155739 RepID=UPI001E2E0740|nr:four helix bundle protein [Moorena producens]
MKEAKELSVIQKNYDVIKWYVPIIDRFPKITKFTLGDRIINGMYNLLEELIKAKYANKKTGKIIENK